MPKQNNTSKKYENCSQIMKLSVVLTCVLLSMCQSQGQEPSPQKPASPPASEAQSPPPASFAPVRKDDLKLGLVAHFPFNGDVQDVLSSNRRAERHGGRWTVNGFGKPDGALSLNGKSDYISIPANPRLALHEAMSISVRIMYTPQPTPEYYTIVEKGDPEREGHARYGLWLLSGHAVVCVEPAVRGAQRCFEGKEALRIGVWNHVVGMYDGETLSVSVNGKVSRKRTAPRSPISQSNYELFIGTDLFQTPPTYTKMGIDDLRIYNRVLSPHEIELLRTLRD